MRRLVQLLFAGAVAAAVGAGPVHAQETTARLSVSVRVAPRCLIQIEHGAIDRMGGVRVQCGRSGLRALRVTTDRGDDLQPVTVMGGLQMRAGAEVKYPVARVADAVASLQPAVALHESLAERLITITLNF